MIAGPGDRIATAIVLTNSTTWGRVIPSIRYSAALRFVTASMSGASTAFMPTT